MSDGRFQRNESSYQPLKKDDQKVSKDTICLVTKSYKVFSLVIMHAPKVVANLIQLAGQVALGFQ
eukprot:snap_masked-scaffold_12-processed-gene-9.19-mRNA-1 protein AED:1.00 eAED:1.00 QI:0/-1/0/0/-1/1/1/0/64